MTENRLIRVQAVTGLVFATFLLVHLANVIIGAAGITHIGVGILRAVRRQLS